MAFAVYRIPGTGTVHFVQGPVVRPAQQTLTSGFYVNVFSTGETFCIQPQTTSRAHSFNASAAWWRSLLYLRPSGAVKENEVNDYRQTLRAAIAAVEQGTFSKLVISRNKKMAFEQMDHAAVLDALALAFPECLVYLFSTPHTGTWLGATPEKLLVRKNDRHYQTMALAGTIRSEEKVHESQWGQKEKEEQAMVEAYISRVIGSRQYEYVKSAVFTLKTGLLNHLCTDFDITLPSVQHMLSLAALLHPTPAVGGLPAREGVHFIKSNEKYLRECYTGYLGPVGVLEQHSLYVNLRCCQLVEGGAVFYAGGGINKGSVAEKEMQEAENKIMNLQRFFPV